MTTDRKHREDPPPLVSVHIVRTLVAALRGFLAVHIGGRCECQACDSAREAIRAAGLEP